MAYIDKSDHIANSYSTNRQTWKWTKKLFFHLLDLTFLNSFILFTSHGAKLTHRDFRLSLVKNPIQEGRRADYSKGKTNPFNRQPM
jgi:hypothetical protein